MSISRGGHSIASTGSPGDFATQDRQVHPLHCIRHQAPKNKISKLWSSVHNLHFGHGDLAHPSNTDQALRSPSKWAMPKHAASPDPANPTSRLKRQLSECSSIARGPLQNATPLGLTDTYEEAKLNLQSLKSGHSSSDFHPRAFTCKRSTSCLPYVTHLVPRSILTESLPQKPAENYLFRALPRPPTEARPAQLKRTTDLGRSSSAPARVRFANPMVEYSTTPSASEPCKFSQPGLHNHHVTRLKAEPIPPPKSCIKSTGRRHQAQGHGSLSALYTDSSSPVELCDSPLQAEFRENISFMFDWIFPKEIEQGGNSQPSASRGAVAMSKRTECLSLKDGPLPMNNNVEKDISSGSTPDLSKPRGLQERRRNTPNRPARSTLPFPAPKSSSAHSVSSIPNPHQPKSMKVPHASRQLEEESSQYANDSRLNIPKLTMSPKIRRIEVTSKFQGTSTNPPQGKRITADHKTMAQISYHARGSDEFPTNRASQASGNRKLGVIPDLPSPIVNECSRHERATAMPHLQAKEKRKFSRRPPRERTDRSPALSPRLASPLILPPRKESRKESRTVRPDSPCQTAAISPRCLEDIKSGATTEPTVINNIGHDNERKHPPSAIDTREINPCASLSDTDESLHDKNATSRFSDSPSVSSEAPSTSSRNTFSPVPSPPAQVITTLDSWNDLDTDHNYVHAGDVIADLMDPSIGKGRETVSSCEIPAKEPTCVIVAETKRLLSKAPETSIHEAESSLHLKSKGSFGWLNWRSEPQPVPHEEFNTSRIGSEDQAVEGIQETTTRRKSDTIDARNDQPELEASATTTPRPQCFCTCSKLWENWDLLLRETDDEPMRCCSESSSLGRSSISSQSTESFLWHSTPQIAVVNPDGCLFSELKSPPIYPEGLRFSPNKTSEEFGPHDDSRFLSQATGIENDKTLDDFQGPVQIVRSVNSPPENQREPRHEFQNTPVENQGTLSVFTARIVEPLVIKKRCLTYKGIATNGGPETVGRHRRKRDNRPSPEISGSSPKPSIKISTSQLSRAGVPKDNPTTITKFEFSVLRFPRTILHRILVELDYQDFLTLSQVSRALRVGFGVAEVKETVLKVFLSDLGYCDSLPSFHAKRVPQRFRSPSPTMELDGKDLVLETKTLKMPLFVGNGGSSLTGGAMPDTFSLDLVLRKRKIHTSNPLEIDLQELHAFQHFQKLGEKRFFEMTNLSTNHRFNVLSIIKAYCRAHNKLVLRARLGSENSSNSINQSRQVSRRKGQSDLYSSGKVPVFRLWMPCASNRMSKADLLKCEVEMLRSKVHSFFRIGDIFCNMAIGSSDNAGRLIYDGQHLHELQYVWDPVGHLPDWLNMFQFPPSFYHHTIKSSNLNPIFYLDLTDYKEQLINSLSLASLNEPHKISHESSQEGMHTYLGLIEIRAGAQTGVLEGIEDFLNNDQEYNNHQEVIHPGWIGKLTIEIQVSSADKLDHLILSRFNKSRLVDFLSPAFDHSSKETRCKVLSQMKAAQLSPWRVIRQKSSPGMVWIRLPIRI
ncbi:hypothetical protein PSTG_08166 [Puccinia striiformis f. sp. tritici PST-78]|uniref:F-box domain-containing protein n=1 Tax=Puccinia striiformis f. sp. tritici PST-78 TaxID=1165861 RepID=A0A0L0VI08_9BASI|nr:hypothetical protein PSTG_08166 [Puccinia striiformis f. sp. tritici PST-78]